ncbi:MAG: penicillin-binding protein 2 [Pseudomonadota bacterium]
MAQPHSITDHIRETDIHLARSIFMLVFVIILLLGLFSRAFYLQVIEHEDYETSSQRNRINVVPVAPTRGLIYDRNGVLLAENQSVFRLEIIPEQVENMTKLLGELSDLINIEEREISRFIKQRKYSRRFNKIPLKQRLTQEQRSLISVNLHRFPGVSIEARLVRYYPYTDSLVHVLGYVSQINEADLAKIDEKNYKATRIIGKLGLEKYYEKALHGTIGFQEVERDAQGRTLRVLRQELPAPGENLDLHLDVNLQILAEEALQEQRGAVVAIDPRNGGVLAMVSSPGYDPNLFVMGIDHASYNRLLSSKDLPLFNRVLQGKYPPGSTIKPMLGLVGLDYKAVTAQYRFFDRGWYTLKGKEHRYRDWRKQGRGWVNMDYAIWDSCDTYFYELAFRLGIDTISTTMNQFGFGIKTEIDVHEEVSALMPSRQWKRGARGMIWFPGETLITGIGQGFWTATPLQLANATAVLANYGVRYQPMLVNSIDALGDTKSQFKPTLSPQQYPFENAENLELVRRSMLHVVTKGTAKTAFANAPYVSAGKTGTAQVKSIAQDEEYDEEKVAEKYRDNAMYVGFAPYDQPTIAIAVVVENAGGGSKAAAPIARKILDYYFSGKPE